MKCFDKNVTVVSQLNDNLFVGVHVKQNSLSIHCPNHQIVNITEEVPYGSLRIITNCACVIKLNQVSIGRSRGPRCKGSESTIVDILLPGNTYLYT